jgi:hypothetical protein
MKPCGHYWCVRCDDIAFGGKCRNCGQPAEFVSSRRTPKEWFRIMKDLVKNTVNPLDTK